MPTYQHGRHEFGQNFLTDPATIQTITRLVAATTGPIVEIGPGEGAITVPLSRLNRPLTAVEIDAQVAERLHSKVSRQVTIVRDDFLSYRLPNRPHVLVGNLPFHLTTAMLRRILRAPGWTEAVLLVQWEVARRRAGVGSSTMMTTQWEPWFDFSLHGRVPASAFTPRPGVDGGILTIHRREHPEVSPSLRSQFHALVHRVYTGPGRGLAQILARNTTLGTPRDAANWLAKHGLEPNALPGAMGLEAWVDLFRTSGTSPPRRKRSASPRRSSPRTPG